MAAMSPRKKPEKLRSTVRQKYGTPRRRESVFQRVALARGYTISAGVIRRNRLNRDFSDSGPMTIQDEDLGRDKGA
jgi:hypothetical protein